MPPPLVYANDSNISLPRRFKNSFIRFLLLFVDVEPVELAVEVVDVVVRLKGGDLDGLLEAIDCSGCETLTRVQVELKLLRGERVRDSGMIDLR